MNALRGFPPGRLLEIGSGAGALLCELSELGFDCTGLETSPAARNLAGKLAAGLSSKDVHFCTEPSWSEPFDYVASFEVLEHIEDDESALRQWVAWLKQDGYLFLSVPARQRQWSSSDVWAGHFRRYEKAALRSLIERVGLRVLRLESYGFPVSNCLDPVRAYVHRKSLQADAGSAQSKQDMTHRSGTDRAALISFFSLYAQLPGAALLWGVCQFQRLFLRTDWGTGYLVIARR